MEQIHTFSTQNTMLLNGIILLITYFFIIFEDKLKIPKVIAALLGAGFSLVLAIFTIFGTNMTLGSYYTNFLKQIFEVIFLLVSMMMVVDISTKSGMYTWVAKEIVKKTKGHPKLVLFSLAFFTAFVSAFLDNVTTVILVMPITYAVCQMLEINPFCFLITEIISSNIGGTATLIGDPPNIIIGTAANFSFMDFVNELTPIICVVFLATISILIFMFRKQLKSDPVKMAEIQTISNKGTITDKPLVIRSCIVLGFIILGFVTHDITHIPAFVIAMLGAGTLLLFEKEPDRIFERVEWNTILFFIGLFLIIGGVEASGAITVVAKLLMQITHGSQAITSMAVLWGSTFIAGVIGNIPYTTAFTPVIASIQASQGAEYVYPIWWSLSLGACLGGNLTIIGAAANVIVSQSAGKNGHNITFADFLKYGGFTTIISIAICAVYICLKYKLVF